MSLAATALKAASWSGAQSSFEKLFKLAVFAVMAHLLGAEQFGLVALATAIILFVRVFVDQGFSQAIVQKIEIQREHLNVTFWINFSIATVLWVFVILLSPIIAKVYKEPSLTLVLQILSFNLPINSVTSVHLALLQKKMEFKSLAYISLVSSSIGGLAGVLLAYKGFGVWALVWMALVTSTIQAILVWNINKWRPSLSFSLSHCRELFSFGVNVLGFRLVEFAAKNIDTLLIGYFLGTYQLGIYNIAQRIFNLVNGLIKGMSSRVSLSAFSKIQEDGKRMLKWYYKSTWLVGLISFPFYLWLFIYAEELIAVVFGVRWQECYPVLQLLALVGFIESVSHVNTSMMLAKGRPDLRLKLSLATAIFVTLGVLLVVNQGIVAVAAMLLLRTALFYPLAVFIVARLSSAPYKEYFVEVLPVVICSFGVLVSAYMFKTGIASYDLGSIAVLVLSVPIAIASYLVLLWLIARAELLQLKSTLLTKRAPSER